MTIRSILQSEENSDPFLEDEDNTNPEKSQKYGGWMVPFRLFVAKRRNDTLQPPYKRQKIKTQLSLRRCAGWLETLCSHMAQGPFSRDDNQPSYILKQR